MKKLVTVIMPLYNAARYVRQTIASLQRQTFENWKLVVVDDCSTDNGPDIVASLRDHRIQLIRHDRNRGAGEARNTGLAATDTPYLAFLDADDLCLPRRLERQIAFLEAHPRVGVVGTTVGFIDEEGRRRRIGFWESRWNWFGRDDALAIALLFRNPFCTSSIMLRREALGQERFSQEFALAEDYELWVRLAQRCELRMLRECHLLYRDHRRGVSKRQSDVLCQNVQRIVAAQLRALGLSYSSEELAQHLALSDDVHHETLPDPERVTDWFRRLERESDAVKRWGIKRLRAALAEQWLYACSIRALEQGSASFAVWRRISREYRTDANWNAIFRLFLKSNLAGGVFQ